MVISNNEKINFLTLPSAHQNSPFPGDNSQPHLPARAGQRPDRMERTPACVAVAAVKSMLFADSSVANIGTYESIIIINIVNPTELNIVPYVI